MNEFRGETLNSVASTLDETAAGTHSALGGAVPALIGGLTAKASTADQANSLLDLIKRQNLDTNVFADAASALNGPGGINGLLNTGRPLLGSIFGGRSGAVADWVSSLSGINRTSSSSLLSLAAPIVLGMIARRVRASGWNASSLMSLLGGQRTYVRDAQPGLAAILNPEETRHVVREEARTYKEPERSRTSPWLWALPLLFLIPLLGYYLAHREEPTRTVMIGVPAAPEAAMPRAITPEPVKPVGTSSTPVAALGPYLIEFQTGSRKLTRPAESEMQKAVEALKAHPGAQVDINGYTDDRGSAAANLKLSQMRATSTLNRLASLGIEKSRMTAEGHGEDDPVADNATAEGRQQNRRVVITVTDR